MSKQSWCEVLTTSQSNGAAVNNSTAYNSLIPAQARYTFPAQYFDTPGKGLRIRAGGTMISNVATTITFVANLANINVFSSGGLSTTAKAATVIGPWFIDLAIICRTVGNTTTANSTTFVGVGSLTVGNSIMNALASGISAAPGLAVDATSNTTMDFGVAWGSANLNCSITCSTYVLESLN